MLNTHNNSKFLKLVVDEDLNLQFVKWFLEVNRSVCWRLPLGSVLAHIPNPISRTMAVL